jgi:beta-mannosidase
VSSKLKEVTATVEIRFISIASGKDISEPIVKKDIVVVPNGSTDVLQGELDNMNTEPHVLVARVWIDGKLVSRDADWPQPLKYLSFKERGLKVEVNGDELVVTAQKPVKGLTFEEREGVLLSDSAIDVMPGDEQVVKVTGMQKGENPLQWMFLGMSE